MTNTKTTYTATAPDGRAFTRTSARTYTHAVVVLCGTDRESATWKLYGFNGRQDLADREAAKLRGTIGRRWVSGHTDYDVAVVPATTA